MAVPVIASTSFTTDAANATTRNIAKPSGTASGDWLIGISATDGSSGVTIPTGFTLVFGKVNEHGTARLDVYKRKADGTEGANFAFGSASEAGNHFMLRITGADSTDAIDVLSYASGEAATIPALPIHTVHDDTLILQIAGNDGGVAITDPGGSSSVLNKTGITAGCSLSVISSSVATPGYAATAAFTHTLEQFSALTIGIRPSATLGSLPSQPYIRNCICLAPAATTAFSYDLPYGTVDDDLLLCIQSSDTTGILSTLSGFTVDQNDSNTAIWGQVQWKKAASETGPYSGSSASSAAKIGVLMRIANADTTTPINQSATPAKGTSTSPASATITPSVNNCLIIAAEMNDDDDVTDNSGYPSGYTGLVAADTQDAADSGLIIGFLPQTTAAATGAATFTLAAAEEWLAFHLAIAPGATGSVNANPTGVSGTAAVGTPTVTGDSNVTPTGVSATGAVGSPTVTGDANVTLDGVQAAGAAGDVTVQVDSATEVPVTGVEAQGNAGDVTVTAEQNAVPEQGLNGAAAGGKRKDYPNQHRYDPTFELSDRRPRLPHEQVLPEKKAPPAKPSKALKEAEEKARIERERREAEQRRIAAEKAARDALILNDNEAFMMLMVG